MKNLLFYAGTALSLLLVTSCAKPLAPVGHYQASPVVADGNADEWTKPLRFSNADHSFDYTVTNDKKNIYVCIISSEESEELRMLRAGISIYFDPKGEKNKNVALEFPVKKPQERNYNNGNPIPASSNVSTVAQLVVESDFYNTVGFANVENGQFSVGDKKTAIQVAIKLHDDSTLVYEAVIPLGDIPGVDPYNTKKNFSVGIGIAAASGRGNNSSNNYSPRPSFGMRGMRMGGGGYRGGSRNPEPKEQTEWYQFRLASANGSK